MCADQNHLNSVFQKVRQYPRPQVEEAFKQILKSDASLQQMVAASGGERRVLASVFLFLDSIEDASIDKKYYLQEGRT